MKKLFFMLTHYTFRNLLFYSLLLLTFKANAQQVKKIDCCIDVSPKATIIINDNTNSTNSSAMAGNNPKNGIFNFELKSDLNTSAGVYNDDGILIRTLWSGVRYETGCYEAQWDGLLDDGKTVAPVGNYQIKLLTNNVQYDWLGVIGNTSTSHLQNEFLVGNGIYDIAVLNSSVYMAQGYAERDITTNRFLSSDIGSNVVVSPGSQSLSATCTWSNGTLGFYAGDDSYSNTHPKFFYAFNPANEQQIIFTNGKKYNIAIDGREYSSVLGFSEVSGTDIISGTATSNFCFISRSNGVLEIYDLRNNSGALLSSTTITGIGKIALSGSSLWVVVNGTPKQFSIAANGVVSATSSSIANSNTSYIAYNSSGNEIVIADQATQQFKFYNATTFALKSVLGLSGGYVTNGPAVTYNKFMFTEGKNRVSNPSIAFLSDGSFWLTDPGNYRIMNFNADHSYNRQIAYVPSSRSCAVDVNNPTKVFADALEYQVDYSKVTTDINASWKLINNWYGTNPNLDLYRQFEGISTLPNGHTYATGGSGTTYLYDLLPSGAKNLGNINGNIEADGSLWIREFNNSGLTKIKKANLNGYDNNDRPMWGNLTTVVTTPTFSADATQPVYYNNNTLGASSNTSRYFFYQQNNNQTFDGIFTGNGPHLGSIRIGENKWEWKTAKTLPTSYTGEYSRNGWFDYSGTSRDCFANVYKSNVFFHTNDELGRFTQVCYTNHFYENGLFIGQFGTDNMRAGYTGDVRFWAGNSFKTQLAKVGNDLYYFYCDESKHAGVHIIKISNLVSIKETSLPVLLSADVQKVTDSSNLLSTLPFKTTNFTGNQIWQIVTQPMVLSTTDYCYESDDNSISVGTSNYGKVRCQLATGIDSNYTLSGQLSFERSEPTFRDGIANYLDFTDQAGKVIVRFEERATGSNYNRTLNLNYNLIPGSDGGNSFGELKVFNNFSYNYNNGILKFQIGKYAPITINTPLQAGADMSKPGFLVINQQGDYGNQYHQINLKNLKFK